MKKQKQKTNNYVLFVLLGTVSVCFVILLIKQTLPRNTPLSITQPTPETSKTRTYYSNALKISIVVPPDFFGSERYGTITLRKGSDKETIVVTRIGTNEDTLEGYLYDISNRNHLTITDKKKIVINRQTGIVAMFNGYKDSDKVYLFYPTPWTVYSLSTSSSSLYDNLDQIAQSFTYIP